MRIYFIEIEFGVHVWKGGIELHGS